jgi:hypothetical protein
MSCVKVHVWIRTDVVGSEVEDTLELDDNLTDEEIESEARDYIFNFIEWGWMKVEESQWDS